MILQELANLSELELIENDGSPSSQKLFVLWNPFSCLKSVGVWQISWFSVSYNYMSRYCMSPFLLNLLDYRCGTELRMTWMLVILLHVEIQGIISGILVINFSVLFN